MPVINAPANVDHLEPAGPPRTTPAGRLAVPVALMDGKCTVAALDLVLDGPYAERLHGALGSHLAGLGAAAAAPARPSKAELL